MTRKRSAIACLVKDAEVARFYGCSSLPLDESHSLHIRFLYTLAKVLHDAENDWNARCITPAQPTYQLSRGLISRLATECSYPAHRQEMTDILHRHSCCTPNFNPSENLLYFSYAKSTTGKMIDTVVQILEFSLEAPTLLGAVEAMEAHASKEILGRALSASQSGGKGGKRL